MPIRIITNDFESTKTKIISKISGENGVDSWVIKHQSQLHHESAQWGALGYFYFWKAKDSESVYLCLQQTEEGAKSEKWETAVGSLHGDMIQLLINHFPELSEPDSKKNYQIRVAKGFSKYVPS